MIQTEEVVNHIVTTLEAHKAEDIVTMDLGKISGAFCRYFVVCQGLSTTHTAALADYVEEALRKDLGENVLHIEGMRQAEWVILDYGNILVHIFLPERRHFYQLEELWMDAETKHYNN